MYENGIYETIAEVGEWDYSWHIGALIKVKSDDRLMFVTDSGCSCYGFMDGLSSEEGLEEYGQTVKNWQEAVELAKDSFEISEVVEFAANLANIHGLSS